MAVLDVESGFDRWAVSSAGRGRADAGDAVLARAARHAPLRADARRGRTCTWAAPSCASTCDNERRDVRRALERYNGSIGHRDYPDRVIVRWTTYWNGADDLGRGPAQPVLKSRPALVGCQLDVLDATRQRPWPRRGPIHSQAMNSQHRALLAAGEHLDAPIRQIARVPGEP